MTTRHFGRIILGLIVTPLVATLFVAGTTEARGMTGGDGDGDGDGDAGGCYLCTDVAWPPEGGVRYKCEQVDRDMLGAERCNIQVDGDTQACSTQNEPSCFGSSSEVNGDGSIAPQSDSRPDRPAVRMVAVAYRGSTFTVSACDGSILGRTYTPTTAEAMRGQTRSIVL
jgi:hypothetical protein